MNQPLVCTSQYLPGYEALLINLDMSGYLLDYYLHLRQHVPDMSPEHDEKLKELIACFALHLTVHPPQGTYAWTVHLVSEKPYSLFVAGSALPGRHSRSYIVGHVLTENIRYTDVNSFHSQFVNNEGTSFRSYVQCESPEIPRMVEHFYAQSEQLPLRLAISRTSDTAVALAALPEYNQEWFATADPEAIVHSTEIIKKEMRTCEFVFACDCSPEKLLPYFRSVDKTTIDELYGTDAALQISCPRCGKRFEISREEVAS